MTSPNPYQGTGDTGTSQNGPNITSHTTGDPHSMTNAASATSLHTWLIIGGAVLLLWLFGGVFFKSIRMS